VLVHRAVNTREETDFIRLAGGCGAITVIVGHERKKFEGPKCFLTGTSVFFKACCHGRWKEKTSREIRMPDSDLETWEVYLQWLYTGELFAYEDIDPTSMSNAGGGGEQQSQVDKHFAPLLELALLADMLQDQEFGNFVVDELLRINDRLHRKPTLVDSQFAYAMLGSQNGMRRLLVDLYAHDVVFEYIQAYVANFNTDFVFDMLVSSRSAVSANRKEELPCYKMRCKSHEHKDEASKCTGLMIWSGR